MFFISWGSRVYTRIFGAPEQHYCELCHQDRTFHNVVTYKIFHIWWLFRWVTQKVYRRVCDVCRNGPEIPAAQVEVKGARSPIPFIDRMGWAAGLGGIAILGGLGSIAAASEAKVQDAELAAPAVGDIYEVDLARMVPHPEAPIMYAAIMVDHVSGDQVEVRLPKTYATGLTPVSNAITDGRARSPDFYTTETTTFTVAALKQLRQSGAIIEVKR